MWLLTCSCVMTACRDPKNLAVHLEWTTTCKISSALCKTGHFALQCIVRAASLFVSCMTLQIMRMKRACMILHMYLLIFAASHCGPRRLQPLCGLCCLELTLAAADPAGHRLATSTHCSRQAPLSPGSMGSSL